MRLKWRERERQRQRERERASQQCDQAEAAETSSSVLTISQNQKIKQHNHFTSNSYKGADPEFRTEPGHGPEISQTDPKEITNEMIRR